MGKSIIYSKLCPVFIVYVNGCWQTLVSILTDRTDVDSMGQCVLRAKGRKNHLDFQVHMKNFA